MDIFPKNKQFSFTTKLNHPIQVQKEQWVVALVEIMTPSEVYNISHNSNYFYVHFYDENVLEINIYVIYIPLGKTGEK